MVSTDGLWDVMPPREAMQYARKDLLRGKRPQEVGELPHPACLLPCCASVLWDVMPPHEAMQYARKDLRGKRPQEVSCHTASVRCLCAAGVMPPWEAMQCVRAQGSAARHAAA